MTAGAWLTLLVLSPLFAGFVYLFYRQWRDHGALLQQPGQIAALAALPALFAGMVWIDWMNPWRAWLQALPSPAAHRMLPAVWAMFSLPLWAVAIICCPHAARDLCSLVSHRLAKASLRWFQALGWVLLTFSLATFGLLAMAGR